MGRNVLFYGPASEIITPFKEDGEVDYDLLKEEVEFLVSNGITGLFANGLASEALMMTTDERVKAVRAAVEASNGRVPIMGNVIYNNVDFAIDCVKRYEEAGVNAIIITPPVVYKYSEEAIFNYFNMIAKSTKLPVYIYNAPETGNKVSPEIIGKLFNETANFWGYKDSTQDIIHQQTMLRLIPENRHFELLAGSDAQIVTTMMIGGTGILSLLSCVFPKLIVEVCDAAEKGDWKEAQKVQKKILRVRQALKIGPFMAAYKYVGQLVGAQLGRMKWPLSELNDVEKQKVTDILNEQNML